ncbi:MAG: hypothetical protein QM734_02920 [Cyclobacteriaceae bacterium]
MGYLFIMMLMGLSFRLLMNLANRILRNLFSESAAVTTPEEWERSLISNATSVTPRSFSSRPGKTDAIKQTEDNIIYEPLMKAS